MITNFYQLLFILCFLNFYIACSGKTPASEMQNKNEKERMIADTAYTKINYSQTILQIDKKCENSVTWDNLFNDKDFINIYEHSAYYIDNAIQFLSDAKYSLHQKTVCVYSMQRAEPGAYNKLFEQCISLFDKGKISELLLSRTISPTFGKKKPIIANYANPLIKTNLEKIEGNGKISQELRLMVAKIISGAYWNNIKKFMEESGQNS